MMKMFSGRHARLDRQTPMLDQHPELAVDRDEVLRPRQAEHQLELFLAGVTRDVGVLDGVVVDVRAGLEEVVDGARHVLLVAGDGAGADDDRVSGLDLHEAMIAVGHARQAGHRLALGAGRGDDDLACRLTADLILAQHSAGLVGQVAQVRGDADVLLHGPPHNGHAAVERRGRSR